jgi:hypothetical protein
MKIVTTVTAVTTYTIARLAVTGVLAQERVHEAGPAFSDREQRYGGLVTHLGIHTVDLCAPLSWRLAAIS